MSGNTAKFDNIAAPAAVPGDYIFYQGVLYIVTAHAANSSINVTKVGNAVEGATGAPYITANNAGWGISGDNRSFDRVQLNPNTPAVGSIIYSAAAGMYFKINSVGSGTVSTTRIFSDLSLDGYATEAYVNGHHDSTKQDKISDLATIRSGAEKGATAVQTETDPTVPSWAKASQKPTYTATEVGAAEAVHRHTLADLDGASALVSRERSQA